MIDSDHELDDRWLDYAANHAAIVQADTCGDLHDAFIGAYAGIQVPGPESALEYAAYVAAAMAKDTTNARA